MLGLLIVPASCSKDGESSKVYIIASEKFVVSPNSLGSNESNIGSWFWAKENSTGKWFWLSRTISGFDDVYESGYEYTIKVNVKDVNDYTIGADNITATKISLIKIIQKEKKSSVGLPK